MKILCFGDSNTYGYDPRGYWGGRYAQPWPEILAALTGWEVCNLGVNGQEIPRDPRVRRTPTEEADRLLVMLGTNDLLRGASAAEAGAGMEAFLTGLIPRCPGIILICPPPMKRGEWVPTEDLIQSSIHLGTEYALLAERLGIPFVDTRKWDIAMAFDGVHFTEEGHRVFAQELGKDLKQIAYME